MRTGQGSLLLHWKLSSQPPDRPYPEAELLAGLHRLQALLSKVPAVQDVTAVPDDPVQALRGAARRGRWGCLSGVEATFRRPPEMPEDAPLK